MAATKPVIVIGAGPVGLCLALALAQEGAPVTIVETMSDENFLDQVPRAGSNHPSTLEFFDNAEPARGLQFADDFMLAALIVRGRAEAARLRGFKFNAGQEAIERQVEIQPRLLAICDDIESGCDLIMNRRDDGIVLQFLAILAAKLIKMLHGKSEPAGKWIAANNSGSKRLLFHNCCSATASLRRL